MEELYAVQNNEGKWFRRKGYGGYGDTWTEKFKLARIYTSISPARSVISFFYNHYQGYPPPKLVKLVINDVVVVDEADRVKKQKKDKIIREAKRNRHQKKMQLEYAKQQLKDSERDISELERELSDAESNQ